MPETSVEVTESRGGFGGYGGYGASRFDEMSHFGSSYRTPGWQRAQRRSEEEREAQGGKGAAGWRESAARRGPMMIEGELVAKSSVSSSFAKGARVFHMKFGPGTVAAVDGNKLTVDFDKAGRKMVLESFLQAA